MCTNSLGTLCNSSLIGVIKSTAHRWVYEKKDFVYLIIHVLLEVRPLSVSDTFDVSDTYLKIIIEPNRIILKFRFATIQIRQKIRCLYIE